MIKGRLVLRELGCGHVYWRPAAEQSSFLVLRLHTPDTQTSWCFQPMPHLDNEFAYDENDVVMDRQIASSLYGWTDGMKILIEPLSDVPFRGASRVWLKPNSVEDWEIMELNAQLLEDLVLHQWRVVSRGQLLLLRMNQMVASVIVEKIESDGMMDVARLDSHTEWLIAPISRPSELNDTQWSVKRFVLPTEWLLSEYSSHEEIDIVSPNLMVFPTEDLTIMRQDELVAISPSYNEDFPSFVLNIKRLPMRFKDFRSFYHHQVVFLGMQFMKLNSIEPFAAVEIKNFGMQLVNPEQVQLDVISGHVPSKQEYNDFLNDCIGKSRIGFDQQVIRIEQSLLCVKIPFVPPSDIQQPVVYFRFEKLDKENFLIGNSSAEAEKMNRVSIPNRLRSSLVRLLEQPRFHGFLQVLNQLEDRIHASLLISRPSIMMVSGQSGIGKTTLINFLIHRILHQYPCMYINCGDNIAKMSSDKREKLFMDEIDRIKDLVPACVVLDDFEQWCPNGPEARKFTNLFSDVIQKFENSALPIIFLVTAQNPKQIQQRFMSAVDYTVNLHAPDTSERLNILKGLVMEEEKECVNNVFLMQLAAQTDGYIPHDLKQLFLMAQHYRMMRKLQNKRFVTKTGIEQQDWDYALKKFKPSGLQSTKNDSNSPLLTWDSIRGLDEVKGKIIETIVWPTRYRFLFEQSRMKIPCGMLLIGPPGCGKTLLAETISKATSLPCYTVKGPELLQKYIGASEQAVRDLFDRALASKPSIIFLDEFDSIVPRRGQDQTGVTDRVVNQFLTLLDGAEELRGVFVIAATNRPDLIDPALLRPGRLDKILYCRMPTLYDRIEILKELSKKVNAEKGINWEKIAELTDGWTGADLQALISNAQLESLHKENTNTDYDDSSFQTSEQVPELLSSVEILQIEHESVVPCGKNTIKQVSTVFPSLFVKEHTLKAANQPCDIHPKITEDCLHQVIRNMRPSLSPKDRLRYEQSCAAFVSGHVTQNLDSVGIKSAQLY